MTYSTHSNSKQSEQYLVNEETEFERLSIELAERELELATLENELSVFEKRYARTVGISLRRAGFSRE